MIDTHCHLNNYQYENDVGQVVGRFLDGNVSDVICVGCNASSNQKAKQIANQYQHVYYAVGYHPDDADSYDQTELESYLIANDNKLVAVGEIGLDYFNSKDNKDQQKSVFISQIELANKYKKPIVIHCRDAYGDTLEILKKYAPFTYGAVMHCYSGSLEFAKELLRLNIKMSFTGTVTFKNARNVQEVATNLPLNSFFFETDSPYLAPTPYRGQRNEPMYVKDICKFVADLRSMPFEELEKVTDSNAKQFYHI